MDLQKRLRLRPSLSLGDIGRRGTITYDPSAIALFAAMTTQPTTGRAILINSVIVAMKTAALWSIPDVLNVTAAADAQAATLNWINPTLYNLTPVNNPVFTADQGFAGDGTTSYLNTNFNPTTAVAPQFVRNSAHYGVWSRTNAQLNGAADIGASTSASVNQNLMLSRRTGDAVIFRVNENTSGSGTNTDSSGHIISTRTASNAVSMWRNGVLINSNANASSGVPNVPFTVCGGNAAGVITPSSTRQYASVTIGAALTPAQLATYFSIINTYLTAVGAA